MIKQIGTLLKDRDEEYGDAWLISGDTVGYLQGPFGSLIRKAPQYAYAWFMILNKLIRACKTPYDIDHWVDIQGYAKLVSDNIYNENHKWKEQQDGTEGGTPDTKSDAGVDSSADS